MEHVLYRVYTFALSFLEKFVLFQSVSHWRFHYSVEPLNVDSSAESVLIREVSSIQGVESW